MYFVHNRIHSFMYVPFGPIFPDLPFFPGLPVFPVGPGGPGGPIALFPLFCPEIHEKPGTNGQGILRGLL